MNKYNKNSSDARLFVRQLINNATKYQKCNQNKNICFANYTILKD
jgi:hypothetical protein